MTAVALLRQCAEEHPRPLAQLLREQDELRGTFLAADQKVGIANKVFDAHVRQRTAEVIRGDGFELVGLVEDDGRGRRQNAGVGRSHGFGAYGGIGKEEMVIHDDQVRLGGATAHLRDEAAAVIRAR